MAFLKRLSWIQIALLLAGVAFLVERLIVTDAEAIEAVADELESAANARDWDAVLGFFSEDFEYDGRDREETITLLRRLGTNLDIEGARFAVYDIEVDGDAARARGRVNARLGTTPVVAGGDVTFVRTPDGWALQRAAAFAPGWR